MYKVQPRLDTTDKIWTYYYLVRVPELGCTSVDYMRQYGTYITGHKQIDQALSQQWMTRQMTIAQMVDLYRDGVQIKIVNESDVKDIYEAIASHLEGWRSQLEHGINIGDAPIDDLIAMDDFANGVYEFARHHLTRDAVNSIMAQHMSNTLRVNPGNFFSKPKTPGVEVTEDGISKINPIDEDLTPERDSLGAFLKDRLVTLVRR